MPRAIWRSPSRRWTGSCRWWRSPRTSRWQRTNSSRSCKSKSDRFALKTH